ncbi:hypothetical protein [Sorangium sp. So ce1024]|uniref:hypothetical protein n=1 Tax=Sorangium sp. So ce1024 TaxID=3133327 RepID=UPI003F0EFB9E
MLPSDVGAVRRRWNVLAVCLLAGAVVQHWVIGARITHAATICWKVGVEAGFITMHVVPQIMFVLGSGIGVALSVLAAQRLLLERRLGGVVALLSTAAYIAGITVWCALLATPFVRSVY